MLDISKPHTMMEIDLHQIKYVHLQIGLRRLLIDHQLDNLPCLGVCCVTILVFYDLMLLGVFPPKVFFPSKPLDFPMGPLIEYNSHMLDLILGMQK